MPEIINYSQQGLLNLVSSLFCAGALWLTYASTRREIEYLNSSPAVSRAAHWILRANASTFWLAIAASIWIPLWAISALVDPDPGFPWTVVLSDANSMAILAACLPLICPRKWLEHHRRAPLAWLTAAMMATMLVIAIVAPRTVHMLISEDAAILAYILLSVALAASYRAVAPALPCVVYALFQKEAYSDENFVGNSIAGLSADTVAIASSSIVSMGYFKAIWGWACCVFLSARPTDSGRRTIEWSEYQKTFRRQLLVAFLLTLCVLLLLFAVFALANQGRAHSLPGWGNITAKSVTVVSVLGSIASIIALPIAIREYRRNRS